MHIIVHSQVNSSTTLMLALVCGPMSRLSRTRLIGDEDAEEHHHIPDHLVTIQTEMASDFCKRDVGAEARFTCCYFVMSIKGGN